MQKRWVVVPLLGSAACHEREPPTHNPPAPTAPMPGTGGTLNWQDPQHGAIYKVGPGDACVVLLPWEGPPPSSIQPPRTQAVACPAPMLDPLWEQCQGGIVSRQEGAADCVCAQFSNPPPPPRTVKCPPG